MILVGELSLWIALLLATWCATVSIAGGVGGRSDLIRSGERAAYATFAFTALASAGLWTALLVFREVSMALLMTSPNNIVLSVRIWQQWAAGRYAEASALGVVLILIMGLLMLLLYRLAGGRLAAGAGS